VGRELILALLAVCVAVLFANALGQSWALLAYLGFLLLTLSLGITDIDSLRIVDRLNLRGTAILVVALVIAALGDSNASHLPRALLGGIAYLLGTSIVFFVARGRGFGFGDVKLSAQLGVFTAYISWGTLGWSVLITALLGGLVSIVVLLVASLSKSEPGEPGVEGESRVKTAMRAELPYGPWMILGSWCAISLAGLGAFPIPT
jgi:leader peptidase (prepilin peptidase) / N-methyltransferase